MPHVGSHLELILTPPELLEPDESRFRLPHELSMDIVRSLTGHQILPIAWARTALQDSELMRQTIVRPWQEDVSGFVIDLGDKADYPDLAELASASEQTLRDVASSVVFTGLWRLQHTGHAGGNVFSLDARRHRNHV